MKDSQFNTLLSLIFLVLANQAKQMDMPKTFAWFSIWSIISLVMFLVSLYKERLEKKAKETANICGS